MKLLSMVALPQSSDAVAALVQVLLSKMRDRCACVHVSVAIRVPCFLLGGRLAVIYQELFTWQS